MTRIPGPADIDLDHGDSLPFFARALIDFPVLPALALLAVGVWWALT